MDCFTNTKTKNTLQDETVILNSNSGDPIGHSLSK